MKLATGDERHAHVDRAALDLRSPACEVAEDVSRPCDIGGGGDARRLAAVQRLELAEFLGACGEDVADPPDQPFPLVGLHGGPRALVECCAGVPDCAVDALGATARNLCEGVACGGVVGRESALG